MFVENFWHMHRNNYIMYIYVMLPCHAVQILFKQKSELINLNHLIDPENFWYNAKFKSAEIKEEKAAT